MANDSDMSGWSDILHSSSKLLEQATPSAQFPPLQRNLDQLELLSKKIKAKTLQTEAPSQSIAATRLLAREGINVEQLACDLKSFELKACKRKLCEKDIKLVWNLIPGCIAWCVWRERNNHCFKDQTKTTAQIKEMYYLTLYNWFNAAAKNPIEGLPNFMLFLSFLKCVISFN
ncbi:nuclear pore complex NUP93A-like [Olea europaea subsp. europaea]|uniref:Nuclear pore complex NUP93A-like n=1 Tax=Olea europaea subsp. europaea TaxID=158383 RepID=A0A8S0S4W5_OLEEU|nr:nuclear pore complex NUP93A-like [Olea europaea subsp. europaea]